jgi:hypothetical protein
MIRKRSVASLALLGCISLGGIGCDTFGGGNNDNEKDTKGHKISTTDSDVRLPSRAERMTSGGGEALSWRADRAGTVYIYDGDSDRVIYSKHLSDGQRVRVDVPHNQVLIDDNVVRDSDLKSQHRYEIYFDRDR